MEIVYSVGDLVTVPGSNFVYGASRGLVLYFKTSSPCIIRNIKFTLIMYKVKGNKAGRLVEISQFYIYLLSIICKIPVSFSSFNTYYVHNIHQFLFVWCTFLPNNLLLVISTTHSFFDSFIIVTYNYFNLIRYLQIIKKLSDC